MEQLLCDDFPRNDEFNIELQWKCKSIAWMNTYIPAMYSDMILSTPRNTSSIELNTTDCTQIVMWIFALILCFMNRQIVQKQDKIMSILP